MKTDAEIQKDVMEELRWDPLLNASEIGVAVKNGIVTLSGTVDAYEKKTAAEEAAKSVMGVKAVAENIQVGLNEAGKRSDLEIAQAVVNALTWHTSVPNEKIKVKVEKGWATLEGEVEWEFQRNAATSAVESLAGVVGITNNIKVTPKIKTNDVKRKIMFAFHRSATIDADKIDLEVNDGKIVLHGKVRSLAEKKDAERAAWLAPGVTTIENNLEIETEALT